MRWAKVYEKKPVRVQAMQWTGTNLEDLRAWGAPVRVNQDMPGHLWLWVAANSVEMSIPLHEWIIRDKLGHYPCSPEVFPETYREVPDAEFDTGSNR